MRSIDLLESWFLKNGFRAERILLGKPDSSEFIAVSKDNHDKKLLFSAKRISYPPATSVARDVAADKTKTYSLAEKLDVSYPDTLLVNGEDYDTEAVSEFLRKYGPVIVKPYNGLQSKGATLEIEDMDSLQNAIMHAATHSDKVLLQKQAGGQEIRFVMIDKRIRAALLRQKPQLTGDGSLSVAKLLELENKSRAAITSSAVPYPQLTGSLLTNKVSHDYIPKRGEIIELSKATMIRNGASVYDVLNSIDTTYVDIATRLASPLIAPLVCIDLMIEDYKVPASSTNYNLIEMNLGMSLPLCYGCRDGKHFLIIEKYLGPKLVQEFNLL